LRLSLFPVEAISDRKTWWSDIVGEEPEIENSKAKLGHYQFAGPWKDGRLALSITPSRIDWFYGPNPESASDESFSGIGTFDNTSQQFRELMSRWLKAAPPARRLAFGAVLNQSVETGAKGIELLAKFLPTLGLIPESTSDFQLQINRTRKSTSIEKLRLNRIGRWSLQMKQRARIAIGETIHELSPMEHVATGCVLELDINNVPEESLSLNEHDLVALFSEELGIAREVATQGDVS
jgi:hypothetical protein